MGQMAGFFGPRRFQPRGIRAEIATARSLSILATLAIIAALYFGKAIFLPLAVAILLTFVLAPPVRVPRGWGVGRIPSVVLVVVLAFLVIFAASALSSGSKPCSSRKNCPSISSPFNKRSTP